MAYNFRMFIKRYDQNQKLLIINSKLLENFGRKIYNSISNKKLNLKYKFFPNFIFERRLLLAIYYNETISMENKGLNKKRVRKRRHQKPIYLQCCFKNFPIFGDFNILISFVIYIKKYM